ncbi:hypothetical protein XA68_18088 [Ophiocordyceps unilateralis]|uniref:Uncharacterized protein n=1 Tax=Ophiocordyceps unilateralis TaxID=268505 RepID=A0A2A9P2Y5_OPHUN|nr:hypothetical protein XA68_18088 [Ophiocordyceps unilateralis]
MTLSTLLARLIGGLIAATAVTAQLLNPLTSRFGIADAVQGAATSSMSAGLMAAAEQGDFSCGSGPAPQALQALDQTSARHRARRSILQQVVVGVYANIYFNSLAKERLNYPTLLNQIVILNRHFQPTNISFSLIEVNWIVDDVWARGGDLSNLLIDNYRGNTSTLNLHIIESRNMLKQKYGQCTYPSAEKFTIDGCVIPAQTIPGAPGHTDGDAFQGKGLVHLLGHWFGLWHTTLGGCDDERPDVADIPASLPTYGCPESADTCPNKPGMDPIHNFMGFNSEHCKREFSAGQAKRRGS